MTPTLAKYSHRLPGKTKLGLPGSHCQRLAINFGGAPDHKQLRFPGLLLPLHHLLGKKKLIMMV